MASREHFEAHGDVNARAHQVDWAGNIAEQCTQLNHDASHIVLANWAR